MRSGKIWFFILILSLFLACSVKETSNINFDQEKETVNAFMNQWHKDAAQGDHPAYIGAMNPKGIYIGTDASENWTTEEFDKWSKPYFNEGKSWAFTTLERNIYLSKTGETAWFDELLKTNMGVCRGSGILEKTPDKWVLNHYVLSLTVPNDNLNEVKKINREKDSIIIANFNHQTN